MKKYLKFFGIILLIFFLGGVVGFFSVGIFEKIGEIGLESLMNGFLLNTMPWLFTLTTIGYLAISFGLYFKGKKDIGEQIRADEPIINDKLLSLSLGLGEIGYFISLVFFVLAVSGMFFNEEMGSDGKFIFLFGIIIANIILIFILQKLVVDFIKTYNPEMDVDVTDLNFAKKVIESSDERERQVTYECGFRAYRAMLNASRTIIVILSIMTYNTSLGVIPLLVVLLVYIIGVGVYTYHAMKKTA